MTRITRKKDVSDSKTEKVAKSQSQTGTKTKKTVAKNASTPAKTKKVESTKTAKVEKSVKNPAIKPTKETAKKEKAPKLSPAKSAVPSSKKEIKITKPKKTATLQQNTLFPEIIEHNVTEIETTTKENRVVKSQVIHAEITAPTQHFVAAAKKQTKPQILERGNTPAPDYFVPEISDIQTKTIKFENIVANDNIIKELLKLGFKTPSETMQKALPAALRGSDLLAIIPKQPEEFLIGAVTAAAKILSELLPKGTKKNPSVLFLAPNQKKTEETLAISSKLFHNLGITAASLAAVKNEAEISTLENIELVDVLIATPQSLNIAIEHKHIETKSVGLCFVLDTQAFYHEDAVLELEKSLSILPQDRTQKIISASENVPVVREMAFQFLENPEYITVLPSQIKEKHPKQFAHTLQATQKFQVLLGHLKTHKPHCAAVFANTKAVAEWIAFKLHGNDIKVELVTSHLPFAKRTTLTKAIKNGEINVIVATDAISNSLGIRELNCIYNFDLPDASTNFFKRLARIEGSKNPLAVSFICEDYGFNIKAIEDSLGFKIHLAQPDKNYFNLKDISKYPLEPNGKVKRIGVHYEDDTTTIATEKVETQPNQSSDTIAQKAPKKYELDSTQTTNTSKLYPRPEKEPLSAKQPLQFTPKSAEPRKNAVNGSFQTNQRATTDSTVGRQPNEKFVRRDDRAKEAIDAARMAAKATQEKRGHTQYSKPSSKMPKRPGLLDIMVSLVQDAVQSAATAAKESVATNIQTNLPTLANVLNKFNILKKPTKSDDDHSHQ